VNSGIAYQEFVNNIPDPKNTIVLSSIFGDGTVIDSTLRQPLEPFLYFGYFSSAYLDTTICLGYIKNNPYDLFDPEEIEGGNQYQSEISCNKDNPSYILDIQRDYHAQIKVVKVGIKEAQDILNGMLITPPQFKESIIFTNVSYCYFYGQYSSIW